MSHSLLPTYPHPHSQHNITMTRKLLPCILAALAVASPCAAFTPSIYAANSCCRQAASSARPSLSALATANDDNNVVVSRRSFTNVIATSSLATVLASPLVASAEEEAAKSAAPKRLPLSSYVYNILRVREATEQETRIINNKKFKDAQRANVKLAIKFILNNYKLSDSVIAASSYLSGNARVQASGVGQSAVQSLFTIIEYFDSSDVENIKVDALSGKEAIVTKGLESVRRDIDEFLSYFPSDVVEEQKAKILEENKLNYKEFDPELGTILNPDP